ncbi:LacI family DNA-binding transcriptional regulator [Cohnella nanjingensis]|uniref:LacI family DNA-binding transcriptional regulator n=1 Tax=Cohnella nanjingensis TaxID=1387779 RepID=A0A7X0RQK2_9BACL|nr:LacI family DNA-binding transcriptional regulator [Cohnella nanjingensis]MBB6670666.1 LacI family DNA-binding transcriptional regulator [Cohnella nanjingensis]
MNIYDIAKEAGVSIATVSRVLNNPAAVSAKTREKVTAIMNQANFTPKLGTNQGKSKDLAFFTSSSSIQVENSIIAGIAEVAFFEKLSIKLCSIDDLPRKSADLASYFADKGIGGAIFTTVPYTEEHYRDITKAVPCVLLFNQINEHSVNYIRADHYKAGYMAIDHLLQMNHTRIAIVDEFRSPDHRDRLRGAMEAIATNKLEGFDENHLINVTHLNEIDMCLQIDYYLERYPETTALFVANDNFVPTLYRHFRTKGIRVPDDFSIIGADDVPGSADLYPPLTTVRQPVKQMSIKAAQYLSDMIHGLKAAEQPMQEIFDVQLIVRASTRKLPD